MGNNNPKKHEGNGGHVETSMVGSWIQKIILVLGGSLSDSAKKLTGWNSRELKKNDDFCWMKTQAWQHPFFQQFFPFFPKKMQKGQELDKVYLIFFRWTWLLSLL